MSPRATSPDADFFALLPNQALHAAMDVNFHLLYLLVGVLLVTVAVLASFVKRLPLSETMIYLAAGTFLGPLGL